MSTEVDDSYEPLGGPESWSQAGSGPAWLEAVQRLGALEHLEPLWTDLVRRGMLLAAAYWSGAIAGLYQGDDEIALRLLAGVIAPAACGPAAEPHVLSNHDALVLGAATASGQPAGGSFLRRLHAVACAPQVDHPVDTANGVYDHVLGHGDYKHHPNHASKASGGGHPVAPVGQVGIEMARLAAALASDAFASLRPAARSAYALHGLTHVGPFAAGNGRVARALASVPLLGEASVPLAVPVASVVAYRHAIAAAGNGEPGVLVAFVEEQCVQVVDLAFGARASAGSAAVSAALRRWEARVRTAHRLHALLPAAVEDALARHRRRADLGWMADLAVARIVGPLGSGATAPTTEGLARFGAAPVVIQAASGEASIVEESLVITAHPVARADDVVSLRAHHAELTINVWPDDVASAAPGAFTARLDAFLDRAVVALAVRVAAEAEG